MKPDISVVIPIYNREKYLKRSIDSVLCQTFKNFELILVDDGSSDSSPEICDEYAIKDGRVKVIHKENGGVSSARNTGISIVSGKYMFFIDSDDYIDETMLETMYTTIQKNDADCVVSGFRFVYESGGIKEFLLQSGKIYFDTSINEHYNELQKNFVFSSNCAKLYKTSIINENNIYFNEKYSILEDGSFVMNYFKCCKNVFLVSDVFYYYSHAGGFSLMKKFNHNALDALEYFSESSEWILNILDDENRRVYYKRKYDLLVFFILKIFTNAESSGRKKRKILREYVYHKCTRNIIGEIHNCEASWRARVFVSCLKYKCVMLLYFFMYIWSKIKRTQRYSV